MHENAKCYTYKIIAHILTGIIFNDAVRDKRYYFQWLTMTDSYRYLSGKGSPDTEQERILIPNG